MKSCVPTLLVIAAALFGGCGSSLPPSSSIVGNWSGRVAPTHFDYLEIRFSQSGQQITGVACYVYGDAPPGLRVAFRDVPVGIDYPDVFLQAPSGFAFTGRFRSDGTLAGESGRPGVSPYPMSLTPGGTYCEP